jgi:chromosome segregation ATPase
MTKNFLYLIFYVNYIWCSDLNSVADQRIGQIYYKLKEQIYINNKELDKKSVKINNLTQQISSKDEDIDRKNVEIIDLKGQNDSQTLLIKEMRKRNLSFSENHALMEEKLASNLKLIAKLEANLKEKNFEIEIKIDQLTERISCKISETLESKFNEMNIRFEKLFGDLNQDIISKKEKNLNESKGEFEVHMAEHMGILRQLSEEILEKQQNIAQKDEALNKMHLEIESLIRDASENLKSINDLKIELDEKTSYFINIIQVKQFEMEELKTLVKKLQPEVSENKSANTLKFWV